MTKWDSFKLRHKTRLKHRMRRLRKKKLRNIRLPVLDIFKVLLLGAITIKMYGLENTLLELLK
jgi:hypothetical protein